MPIYIPGVRDRGNRKKTAKRNVVATLSLTAMVDLFTVLAVFLIQNYAATGEVIHISEGVKLPEARETKELKPSNIISISDKELRLNDVVISDFITIKEQRDWIIRKLQSSLEEIVARGERDKVSFQSRLRDAVRGESEPSEEDKKEVDSFRKITIQADKKIDFLTVKKVMYTVTESGIYEINFAVIKRADEDSISI